MSVGMFSKQNNLIEVSSSNDSDTPRFKNKRHSKYSSKSKDCFQYQAPEVEQRHSLDQIVKPSL